MKKVVLFIVVIINFNFLEAVILQHDGWNLVSVCQDINQSDVNMSGIEELQSQDGESIYTGDYRSFSNLEQLEAGYGYWVKGNKGSFFNVEVRSTEIIKPLKYSGWNLMAACEDIITDDIDMNEIEEIKNQLGHTFTGSLEKDSNLSILLNGHGYWIKGDAGAKFKSKSFSSFLSKFKYKVINNRKEVVDENHNNYTIKFYSDYEVDVESKVNNIPIVITINGIELLFYIQNVYLGHEIVVTIYNENDELQNVLNASLVIEDMFISFNLTDANELSIHSTTNRNNSLLVLLKENAIALDENDYVLSQITDDDFNSLEFKNQIIVADKLLSTLYFGMPYLELKALIKSGKFITTIKENLSKDLNDVSKIEAYINNADYFHLPLNPDTKEVELVNSNAVVQHRFFAYEHLDKNFFEHWMTYVLTQSIMFSPASELSSSRLDSVMPVYEALYSNIKKDASIRYLTYRHISSLYNWRRFRSSEDNGREMLEVFLFDRDDSHVPPAAQALQNWKLDDKRELTVSTDGNVEPILMFNQTIYSGYEFYTALVLSDTFMEGIIRRIVNIYFNTFSATKKNSLVSTILLSQPENFKDIFLQIIFSKEHLYNTNRVKTIDELFYSLSKKIHFGHDLYTFQTLNRVREGMHQSPMRYKLGVPVSVPIDASSFGIYREYIYKEMLIKIKFDINTYEWGKNGWIKDDLLNESLYEGIYLNNLEAKSEKFLNYLFLSTVSREISSSEWEFFYARIEAQNSWFEAGGEGSTQILFDYISRLTELFQYQKVK